MRGFGAGLEAKVARRLQPKFRWLRTATPKSTYSRRTVLGRRQCCMSGRRRPRRDELGGSVAVLRGSRRRHCGRSSPSPQTRSSACSQLDDDRDVRDLGQTPSTAVKGAVGTAELPVKKAIELAMHERGRSPSSASRSSFPSRSSASDRYLRRPRQNDASLTGRGTSTARCPDRPDRRRRLRLCPSRLRRTEPAGLASCGSGIRAETVDPHRQSAGRCPSTTARRSCRPR